MTPTRELRVLVMGCSLSTTISPPDRRGDLVFGQRLVQRLREHGYVADLRTSARAGQSTAGLFSRWEEDIQVWRPDVIITSHGGYEVMYRLIPGQIERHAHDLNRRPTPIRRFYRKRMLRPTWKALVSAQRAYMTRFPLLGFERVKKQTVIELRDFAVRARRVAQPRIFFMDLMSPTEAGLLLLPGIAERAALLMTAIEDLVSELNDPSISVLPIGQLAAETVPAGENPTPDGFHYTAALHRTIGDWLADEVLAWLEAESRTP